MTYMQMTDSQKDTQFLVIHPLDDVREAKPDLSHLGRMPMNRPVKISLQILRGYLILMTGLVTYHVLVLANLV